ncbi:MAG TPA: hypothetical protein VK674_06230 [Candidatus Limnocylindria bacterium]|nr:hypothetical protein [Candidatus Limnocylindria bacterium]
MAERYRGLYVAVGVMPTDELHDMFEEIPPEMGVPVAPARRHITTTFPEDFPEAGIAVVDRDPMEDLLLDVEDRIGALGLSGEIMGPGGPLLKRRKNFATLFIKPDEVVLEVHNAVSAATKAAFGVVLPLREEGHHFSATSRPYGGWREAPAACLLPETDLIADGYRVRVNKAWS